MALKYLFVSICEIQSDAGLKLAHA